MMRLRCDFQFGEVFVEHVVRQLGKRAGEFDSGRAATDNNESQQRLTHFGIGSTEARS
jgi:hypothetical protein